jgi:ADP-heptose:LPS heptosyltransferase
LSSHDSSIQRILLVRTDRLGDVLLTLPMLSALRSCFPQAHIAMLLRRYTGDIVQGNPHVDELIWYDDANGLVPFRAMAATLREHAFDAAIVVYPRFRLAWLMFRAGIPIRVGTGYRYYSILFNRKVYEHRKDAQRHELEYNLTMLNELQCSLPSHFMPEFLIQVPEEAERCVKGILDSLDINPDNFVVVHPGSGGSAREWSPENFGKLSAKFAHDGFKVLVTGGSSDEDKVSQVVQASNGTAVALAGMLNLKELSALLRSARLFVSNSTGPLHLAVAMKTPVVGFFPQHTAMSVKRWGPYTDNKMVFVPDRPLDCNVCIENKSSCECMATIAVEQVYKGAVSLMNRNKRSSIANA